MATIESVTAKAIATVDECLLFQGMPTLTEQFNALNAQITSLQTELATVKAERDTAQQLAADRRVALDNIIATAQAAP